MQVPLPAREDERLRALRSHAIMDTSPEAAFDRITRLAARLLRVPITLVALVDENRQWFKSNYGPKVRETDRESAFCAHAILGEDLMIVPDALKDARFTNNPLVTGEPHIRFYAGAPLRSLDGFNLGTLCAIDTVPRQFTAEELEILRDLAAIAGDELELRRRARENRQQAAAIAKLNTGVVITDSNQPDNPMVFVNPGFCEMTGYSPEELIGRNCRFLQGAETAADTIAAMHRCVEEGRPFEGVLANYRKDGTMFWNELKITPVFDEQGELVSFAGLQTDVTERKRASDELRNSFEKLKRLETLRDDLTHMIIHDLRSPLTTVTGFLDLLQMIAGPKLNPKELGFVQNARNGVRTLAEMITSLLDVNRLEAGEMPLSPQCLDLAGLVRDATEPFAVASHGTRFVREFPTAAVKVRADADLITRVIANLVNNALKFTPAGGEVKVSVTRNGIGSKVAVSDTGAGIPAEYHQHIFEKFGQVGERRDRHSSGLGLTFCKLAVEANGGKIGLESQPGAGSTFWFVLPNT